MTDTFVYTPDNETTEKAKLKANGWTEKKDGCWYDNNNYCRIRFDNYGEWGFCAIHEQKRGKEWRYNGHVCIEESSND